MRGSLAVIAKSPQPGRVKTRLCPPCSPSEAAALAEAALRDTLAAVLSTRCERRLLVLDGESGAWAHPAFEVIEQRGGTLDERLTAAFEDASGPTLLIGMDPIVVDNGSTDGSAALARRLGARVVSEPRRGFGAACAAGLSAATAEVVCFMDCDGSLDPREVPDVADPVASGEADLVLGRRLAERGAWPLHARVANRLLAAEIRRRSGLSLSDLGPMRAAPTERLRTLGIRDRRFGWPLEMVILAAAEGWRISEVPVRYLPREGRSKVTGTVRGTARTLLDMSRVLRGASSSQAGS